MGATLLAMATWKDIPGYEGVYQASDEGEIKSLSGRFGRPLILRPGRAKRTGHYQVVLTKPGTELQRLRRRTMTVHALVMLTFVGPLPAGAETRHIDGDVTNNHLANLRYGSRSENQRDSVRHGTHNMARKTHCPANHEYTPENTRITVNAEKGWRMRSCKTCARERHTRAVV